MKKVKSLIFVVAILLTAAGCNLNTIEMLNKRRGQMNFEEALQRFGPPTNCAETGATKVCTWVYGRGGTTFVPIGKTLVAVPQRAPSARLTFVNGVLWSWRLTGNWE